MIVNLLVRQASCPGSLNRLDLHSNNLERGVDNTPQGSVNSMSCLTMKPKMKPPVFLFLVGRMMIVSYADSIQPLS